MKDSKENYKKFKYCWKKYYDAHIEQKREYSRNYYYEHNRRGAVKHYCKHWIVTSPDGTVKHFYNRAELCNFFGYSYGYFIHLLTKTDEILGYKIERCMNG